MKTPREQEMREDRRSHFRYSAFIFVEGVPGTFASAAHRLRRVAYDVRIAEGEIV
jgi:hypothetical protein